MALTSQAPAVCAQPLKLVSRASSNRRARHLWSGNATTCSPCFTERACRSDRIVAASANSPAPSASTAAFDSSDQSSEDTEGFSWTKQWYPVAIQADLEQDLSKPHAVTVLGKPLVVWRECEEWRVYDDACPHRLAPLSEGRIEPSDGSLMCSYHGWTFKGEGGGCANIPQADGPAALATACGSGRSCATSYPARAERGLIWAWLEPGPAAHREAATRDVPFAGGSMAAEEAAEYEAWTQLGGWFSREVPYGYQTLMENLFDPSHVVFVHHGVIGGARREKACDVPASVEVPPCPLGFVTSRTVGAFEGSPFSESRTVFEAPTLCRSENLNPASGRGTVLIFYGVPIGPTRSRIYAAFFSNAAPAAAAKLRGPWVDWYFHLAQMDVIDGDMILLVRQEQRLAAGDNNWKKQYYMPMTADTVVIAFRTWFHDVVANGVPYPPGTDAARAPPSTREEMLDRYHTHVKDCPSCSAVLQNARRTRTVSVAGLAVWLGAAGHWASDGVPAASEPAALIGTLLAGAALVAAWTLAGQLERRLTFIDYTHYDRE